MKMNTTVCHSFDQALVAVSVSTTASYPFCAGKGLRCGRQSKSNQPAYLSFQSIYLCYRTSTRYHTYILVKCVLEQVKLRYAYSYRLSIFKRKHRSSRANCTRILLQIQILAVAQVHNYTNFGKAVEPNSPSIIELSNI